MSPTSASLSGIGVDTFAAAVTRAKAHYNEMPGLTLTLAQAMRLWACDERLCNDVLTALVEARFLTRTHNSAFALAQ